MKIVLAKLIGFFINIIAHISPTYAVQIAIKLFSTPLKGKHLPEGKDFLNTAFQEEVIYKDFSIMTYRWLGEKDTILLVHGWESNAFRWKDLIEKLKQKGYNIVAIDAPAHGKSGGKYFNTLDYSECIHLVAKKFKVKTIIGHSVGGMATIFFQHKYQFPHLERIVLLGAPSNFKDIFERYVNMMGYHNILVKHIDEFILKKHGHRSAYFEASKFSKDITSKGLIIHDDKDNIIPYKDALDYQVSYTNAKLITTNNLDHSLKSENVDNHILEFISN